MNTDYIKRCFQNYIGNSYSKEERTKLKPEGHLAELGEAAILVGLQELEPNKWSFLYTLRSNSLRLNKGDVCFPGGKIDRADSNVIATACREAEEEIGLTMNDMEILGQLPPIISGNRVLVHPVAAIIRSDFEATKINRHEVADVFYASFEQIGDPMTHRFTAWIVHCGVELPVDYFDVEYGGHIYSIHAFTASATLIVYLGVLGKRPDCQKCQFTVKNMEKYGGMLKYMDKMVDEFRNTGEMGWGHWLKELKDPAFD